MTSDAKNYRHFLLVLIVVSQVLSPVLFIPGGESFGGSVFRVILLVVAAAFGTSTGLAYVAPETRRAILVCGLLAGWMAISLMWSDNTVEGLRQVSYVVTILLLIYVLNMLVRTEGDFSALAKMVFVTGAVVMLLSYYEVNTGNHFFRASIQDVAEAHLTPDYGLKDQAWFTFGNPNDLAVHIAFCCFMVPFYATTFLRSLAALFYTGSVIYLSDELDARIVILALVAYGGVFLAGYAWSRASHAVLASRISAVAGHCVLLFAVALSDKLEFLDLSTFIRLRLVGSAISMGVATLFVGAGAGDFEGTMWTSGLTRGTYGIVNPHNAFARIFAENGLLGLLMLIFLIFGPLSVVRRSGRATVVGCFIAGSAAALPFLFSSGSDPLSASTLQLAIALLWVCCKFARDKQSGRRTN